MKKNKKITVIIAAGGTGTRFGGKVPKQFAMLGKRPVLWHTLTAFNMFSKEVKLIISMHAESIPYWNKLVKKYSDTPAHQLVKGGKTRFQSVKNALACCPDEGIILIHDAVRPFVSFDLIERVVKATAEKDAAIPVVEITDTIRQITKTGSIVVNRNNYVRIQTPQGFKAEIIKKAYYQRYKKSFTDDATVVENSGIKITFVEGCNKNQKITFSDDL